MANTKPHQLCWGDQGDEDYYLMQEKCQVAGLAHIWGSIGIVFFLFASDHTYVSE